MLGYTLTVHGLWFWLNVLLVFYLHMASCVILYGWLANYNVPDRQASLFQQDDTDMLLLTY